MTEYKEVDPGEEDDVPPWLPPALSPAGLAFAILELVLRAIGAAAVRKHVDLWEAQRAKADAAEDAKFGPER